MTNDVKTMERTRDLQMEVGAIFDRFHEAGLPAFSIMEVLSAESEIWLARTNREEMEAARIANDEAAARERTQ